MAQDPGEMTPPPTAAELRSQIEETRTEMGETINAIQERLSPSRIMTDAKETVKEATVGRVKSFAQRVNVHTPGPNTESSLGVLSIVESVKNNPLPAALIGLAAAGILIRALTRPQTDPSAEAWRVAEQQRLRRPRNPSPGIPRNVRFMAAISAGACWALWKAQAATPRDYIAERHDATFAIENHE